MNFGEYTTEDVCAIKPHERHDSELVTALKADILKNGLIKPIVVDKSTKIVLDGHHRLEAFKQLNYEKIPVCFVDYNRKDILVSSWNGIYLSKKEVISKVASGSLFPKKTTKHLVRTCDGAKPIIELL